MIEISRPDVPTDYLVDYPESSRFLKIPIKPYVDLLGVEPIPSQVGLINAVNNPKYRFIVAALSRRQGKTYIANIIAQLVALVPGLNVLIMSPNYSLSSISFELQRKFIRHFDLEVTKDNTKDRIITLDNGSNIRMGSISQVDSCVGVSYHLIIFDEAALTDAGEDAFNVALRPTLDKPDSKAIFISTPRGKANWFSRFYERGYSDKFPSWCSIRATWEANPRISMEDIEDAKRSMTRAHFLQEYECSFNSFEGAIWELDRGCVQDLSELDTSRMDIIAGLDWGFKDATAMVVAAYCWDDDVFYLIDEYKAAGKTTEAHAIAIKEIVDKWNVDFIFIDSAAAQTKFDLAQLYDISCTNAKKSVLDGVGRVGTIIENNKLIVSKTCTHSLEAIDNYRWDTREGLTKERPMHDDASHIADALRYMLFSFELSSGTV